MSSFFQPGQELDETGLKISFSDNSGDAITTLEVLYSIYYLDDTTWTVVPDQYQQVASASATPGLYYAQWDIPFGQNRGKYQVRWDFRESVTSSWKQRRLNFHILSLPVGPSRTAEVSDLPGEPICVVL